MTLHFLVPCFMKPCNSIKGWHFWHRSHELCNCLTLYSILLVFLVTIGPEIFRTNGLWLVQMLFLTEVTFDFRTMDLKIFGPMDFVLTWVTLDFRTNGLSDQWTIRFSDQWTLKLLNQWTLV